MTIMDPTATSTVAEPSPAPSTTTQLDAAAASPAASTPEPAAAVTEPAPAPFDHTATPSLLESITGSKNVPTDEPAPAEAAPVTTEAAPQPQPEAQPQPTVDPATQQPQQQVQQPTIAYQEFKLPEGVKPVGNQMDQFKELAGKYGMSQEAAQSIIDMHINSIKEYDRASAQMTLEAQHRAFADVRKSWQTAVLSDEQLGGAGHQTAMAAVARARDMLVPKEDRAAFDQFLRITGAGDHPAFLRLLHNASRRLDEPAYPPSGAKPAPQTPAKRGLRSIYNPPT